MTAMLRLRRQYIGTRNDNNAIFCRTAGTREACALPGMQSQMPESELGQTFTAALFEPLSGRYPAVRRNAIDVGFDVDNHWLLRRESPIKRTSHLARLVDGDANALKGLCHFGKI